ncbi:hypothetical protein HNQ04_001485 [Deinococcus radiopugnans ATCC 19172]|uniref:Uncharacterized protein n=1 Tax=Deinococcus radiopugnans ATCC 19172 TaxID=585398 RepID=A0ABR6NQD5_9DEIO|nr:hypothetical protein [Deinococcus radiopugnans ATCC 19172]
MIPDPIPEPPAEQQKPLSAGEGGLITVVTVRER